jgi:amidase
VSDTWAFVPAGEQADAVRAGKVSPVELVELYLDRIERHDGELRSYITVRAEGARADALVLAERLAAGEEGGPLCGVPVSVKDHVCVAGLPVTWGSGAFRDRIADHDDAVVRRLRDAGAIVLGKTSMPEFGVTSVGDNRAYGHARNPWDTDRTTGGSSAGAAAALAAGLCGLSHGSDGGGSVRIPAALCGVVGLKPQRGRVSFAPEPPMLFGVHGVLSRTVADAALTLDVMAGMEPGDPWWAPPAEGPFADAAARAPRRLRIAVTTDPFIDGVSTAAPQRQAVERVAEVLSGAGHMVEPGRPPWDAAVVQQAIAMAASEIAVRAEGIDPDGLEPFPQMFVTLGAATPGPAVAKATSAVMTACRPAVAWFQDVDILLTPTVAVDAPRAGALAATTDIGELMEMVSGLAAFTGTWNFTGQPAITLPAGFSDDGLPLAVQLVGRPAEEGTLLAVAAELEALLDVGPVTPARFP